jgi:hypothetical protein
MIEGLDGMAGVALDAGDAARAARWFGTAEAQREAIGRGLAPVYRETRVREVEAARSGMTEAAFRTAWEEGRASALEQAVAEALDHELFDG